MTLRSANNLYGQGMQGFPVAALGPQLPGVQSDVGAASDVGRVSLTKAQRIANMRASVERYKKQAAAQKKRTIVLKYGPYTKELPGDTPLAVIRRHRMNLANQAKLHQRATAKISTKGGLSAIAARVAAQKADRAALAATGAQRQRFLKQSRTSRKTAARATAAARRGGGMLKGMSRGIRQTAKRYGATGLRLAATGASFVPVVGTAAATGLGAAAALASGASWEQIALEAALSAVPGGAAAQMAAGTGVRLMRGQRIDRALLAEALKHVPGGALGAEAARTGLAVARGQRVDRALRAGATRAARTYATQAARGLVGQATRHLPQTPAVIRRPLMSTRLTAHLRSPDPLRGGRLGPIGRPPGFGTVGSRLAKMAIARRPALAVQSPAGLARALGVPTRSAAAALSGARPLRWRPLRGRAPAFVRKLAQGYPTRYYSRRDAAGLAPDGATWTIEKGDTLSAIARKLTGDAARWREFLAANPTVKRHPSWGLEVYTGDVLAIPADWRPASAPTPAEVTAAEVLKSKATLKAWSLTDGADQPGVTDYGTRPEDLSAVWSPRDRLMLSSFSRWKGGLPVDGELTQPHVDALADWAEARAGVPTKLPLPVPQVPPPTLDAPAPAPGVVVAPTPPALPPAPPVVSLPAPPVVSVPTPTPAPMPTPTRPRPSLPAPPPVAAKPPPSPPVAPPAKKPAGAGTFAALLAAAYVLL